MYSSDMDNTPEQAKPKAKPYERKMTDMQWAEVKVRAESGESFDSIASLYPIGIDAIRKQALEGRWSTPRRVAKALRGELAPDDPAQATAAVWAQRKEASRETVFQGSRKALDRFFAMSPVPQSFSEAAIAAKLLNDSISPLEQQQSHGNVNLAILTQVGFQPRIQED